MRTALIAGATGLVGSQCLARLLREPAYERVIALVRRPLPQTDPRLDLKVIDFDRLGAEGAAFPAATDVFCCLGTTMKKAGADIRVINRRISPSSCHPLCCPAARLGSEELKPG